MYKTFCTSFRASSRTQYKRNWYIQQNQDFLQKVFEQMELNLKNKQLFTEKIGIIRHIYQQKLTDLCSFNP